jgi:uncharacterized protein (DUF2236 family)
MVGAHIQLKSAVVKAISQVCAYNLQLMYARRRTIMRHTTPSATPARPVRHGSDAVRTEAGLPDGFPFTTESAIRRYAEPIAVIMIAVIAGMDVAHPSIGAGVDHHSDFRRKPLRRALITADALILLVFGDTEEAIATAKRVQQVHGHVQGRHDAKDGPDYAGTSYYANDGQLQRWVLATGFYGVEMAHKRWIHPLTPGERQALYQDLVTFGHFFGIPKGLIPTDVQEHDAYMEEMLNGDLLGSTASSQEMVRRVFSFRHWTILPPLPQLIQAVARTSLDPRFQKRLGIQPTKRDYALARAFDTLVRRTYPHVPGRVRRGAIPSYLAIRRLTLCTASALHWH